VYESNTKWLILLPYDLVFRVLHYEKQFMNSVFEAALFQTLSALYMRNFTTYGTRGGIFLCVFYI